MSRFHKAYQRLLEDITTKRNKIKFDYNKKGGDINTALGKSTKETKFSPRITTLPLSRVKVLTAYAKKGGDDHVTDILKSIKKSSDSKYKMNDQDYESLLKRTALFFYKQLKNLNVDTILVMESSSSLAKDIGEKLKSYFPDSNIRLYNGMIHKNINNMELDFDGAKISDEEVRKLTNILSRAKADNSFSIKKIKGSHRKFFKNWIDINKNIIKYVIDKNVVVIDDYLTTGSTLDAAGLSLNKLSPKSLTMVTIIK